MSQFDRFTPGEGDKKNRSPFDDKGMYDAYYEKGRPTQEQIHDMVESRIEHYKKEDAEYWWDTNEFRREMELYRQEVQGISLGWISGDFDKYTRGDFHDLVMEIKARAKEDYEVLQLKERLRARGNMGETKIEGRVEVTQEAIREAADFYISTLKEEAVGISWWELPRFLHLVQIFKRAVDEGGLDYDSERLDDYSSDDFRVLVDELERRADVDREIFKKIEERRPDMERINADADRVIEGFKGVTREGERWWEVGRIRDMMDLYEMAINRRYVNWKKGLYEGYRPEDFQTLVDEIRRRVEDEREESLEFKEQDLSVEKEGLTPEDIKKDVGSFIVSFRNNRMEIDWWKTASCGQLIEKLEKWAKGEGAVDEEFSYYSLDDLLFFIKEIDRRAQRESIYGPDRPTQEEIQNFAHVKVDDYKRRLSQSLMIFRWWESADFSSYLKFLKEAAQGKKMEWVAREYDGYKKEDYGALLEEVEHLVEEGSRLVKPTPISEKSEKEQLDRIEEFEMFAEVLVGKRVSVVRPHIHYQALMRAVNYDFLKNSQQQVARGEDSGYKAALKIEGVSGIVVAVGNYEDGRTREKFGQWLHLPDVEGDELLDLGVVEDFSSTVDEDGEIVGGVVNAEDVSLEYGTSYPDKYYPDAYVSVVMNGKRVSADAEYGEGELLNWYEEDAK